MGDGSSDMATLVWARHPDVTVVDRQLHLGRRRTGYQIAFPHPEEPFFQRLARVTTPDQVRSFTAQWGLMTEDREHTWVAAVLHEAEMLRAAVEIWEGTQRRGGLREWTSRAGGVTRLRELVLGVDDEWRHRWKEIEQRAPERATAIAPAWLQWAVDRGLRPVGFGIAKEGQPAKAFPRQEGRWHWHLGVPDLLTFCYVELAAVLVGGKLPSLCPYCGEVFLVRKRGRQRTCGKDRCRQKAVRHRPSRGVEGATDTKNARASGWRG